MNKEQLLEIVEATSEKYQTEQIKMLEKFCKVDCPSKHEEGIEICVEIILEVLNKMDVNIERYYTKGFGSNIVATIKPQNPNGKVIVSAHIDTFSGFKIGDIQKNPFRIENDWAYGVGISDCKAGLVSSLYSVRIMQ